MKTAEAKFLKVPNTLSSCQRYIFVIDGTQYEAQVEEDGTVMMGEMIKPPTWPKLIMTVENVRNWIHHGGELPSDWDFVDAVLTTLGEWRDARKDGMNIVAMAHLDEVDKIIPRDE